jgi:putative methyltransferase
VNERLFALVCVVNSSCRYRAIVEELVSESSLRNRLTDNKPTEAERAKLCIWKWLAFVLIYEMLFGMGIKGGGYVQRVIKSSHAEFDRLLTALKERRGESDVRNLLPAVTPTPVMGRFARVNLLKVSVADALQELFARGFALEKADDGDEPVQSQRVRVDALVPYVLELAPGCDLHADPLVVRGALILQDKASCLPAAALAPPRHAVCVDACAAPGNKTTHLAALIAAPRDDSPRHSEDAEQGVVVAIDRDRTRLATLLRGVELAGASHLVVPYCDDFLRVSEAVATFGASAHARSLSKRRRPDTAQRMTAPASNADRARVQALLQRATHALVDPSCSVSRRAIMASCSSHCHWSGKWCCVSRCVAWY